MLSGPGNDGPLAASDAAGAEPPPEMFGTETMAELYARQGRLAEAIAVYRRLLASGPAAERRGRWLARLETLDRVRVGATAGGSVEAELPRPEPGRAARRQAPSRPLIKEAVPVPHRLPMTIREPVRSGQVVYAEKSDLIVLAPVSAGAELVADGNIHVYATLRGRAFAGAEGCAEARVFCQRLEAELVAINDAYLLYDDIPLDRRGRPAQVLLRDGRCVILPL
jgi:septum formation inhibitor MinC